MESGKSAGTAGRKTGWNTYIIERTKMKALVEIVLIWGIVLALVLAAFLLNFWLIHRIDLLVGVNATRAIIGIGALMATIWIFGHKGTKA
jgi:hypothetical protein